MTLPLKPPVEPMEATSVDELPAAPGWAYEPKWDGFRCLVFRDGNKIDLQSKSGQPFVRYFPEIASAMQKVKPAKFILDGELVVPRGDQLSFDDLLQRIHPAASRVKRLAPETPALFVAFDLLIDSRGRSLYERPQADRRAALEEFALKAFKDRQTMRLSPSVTSIAKAKKWWDLVGGNLDGIVCKRLDMPYRFGLRDGMVKVKRHKTADCVVGGFRYAAKAPVVGSLLLGLYDEQGLLNHIGFTSALSVEERQRLTPKLEKLIGEPGFNGQAPGGPSRWSTKRSTEWEPLKPKLVVEVSYDHFTGGRFRHGTTLVRWRPDKKPKQCTMEQIADARNRSLRLLDRDDDPH
jgi:ATP-dependent DNA ligase